MYMEVLLLANKLKDIPYRQNPGLKEQPCTVRSHSPSPRVARENDKEGNVNQDNNDNPCQTNENITD
jgi:hypothetical protein